MKMRLGIYLLGVCCLCLLGLVQGTQAQNASDIVDFEKDVLPIISARCWHCHGGQVQEGGYRLENRKAALGVAESGSHPIVPGDTEQSSLLELVRGEEPAMPDGEAPLSASQVEILTRWIAAGAHWPDHLAEPSSNKPLWSLQPLSLRPQLSGDNSSAVIDRLVEEQLARAGLQPLGNAEPQTLIRRLYLDVWGLPPSPEDVKKWAADWSDESAGRLIKELLASPHYGERWARHWLDVVRFAESNGFETNVERLTAYHYRDWVIEALNGDLPYNEFLAAQIAGEQLGHERATGFLVAGTTDQVKSPDRVLTLTQRQDELADMVNTTGTAFLGLTMGCARCHHHKFDPLTQTDYFALAAVFAGVQHGERKISTPDTGALVEELAKLNHRREEIRESILLSDAIAQTGLAPSKFRPTINSRENIDRFEPRLAKFVRFVSLETNQYEPCLDELEVWGFLNDSNRLTNLGLMTSGAKVTSSGDYPDRSKHKLEQVNDGQFGNDFSWISNTVGQGWIQIELPLESSVTAVVWGRDRTGAFQDRTPTKYRIEVAREANQWELVADSGDRLGQSAASNSARTLGDIGVLADHEKTAAAMREIDEQIRLINQQLAMAQSGYLGTFVTNPESTHRLQRGEVTSPEELVSPGIPSIFGKLGWLDSAVDGERRLGLATWLRDSQHPLLARVIVNRIWQHHFGVGLVATSSDFGTKGSGPSHPELLDWLAGQLISHEWSLKHVHRLILNSATYQRDHGINEAAMLRDADDRLLWRFRPRRLEAEAIRDSMLAVSGELDLTAGGPGFSVFKPNSNYVRVYEPKDEFGPAEFRRMIYMMRIRVEQDGTFGAFDSPDGALVCPVRSRSVTPIQALNLLNSPFVTGRAAAMAERLRIHAGNELQMQIGRAFQLAYGRDPAPDELLAATRLASEFGLPALCRAMLNSNEFLILP